MVALTQGRTTPRMEGEMRGALLAAAANAFAGAILMRNAAGHVLPGATATGSVGCGVAERNADNSAGAAGDKEVLFRKGAFRFANSAAADLITIADIGTVAYIVDDQTVAKTDGGTTRSPAGTIEGVDDQGVWVRFDEALTTAAAS